MARILLFFVIMVGVSDSKHLTNFRRNEDIGVLRKVACEDDEKRIQTIRNSLCGEPRDVFVELKLPSSFLQVVPNFVWVKRCVGLCTAETPNAQCFSTSQRTDSIPVRLYDIKTNKESCATYDVVVHESCGCRKNSTSVPDCNAPQKYNPRKLSCQCPNMEERRNCLRKKQMNRIRRIRWNRTKCACETRGKYGEHEVTSSQKTTYEY